MPCAVLSKLLKYAVVFFLLSCTPQQRLKRLLKKHPELLNTDTIYSVKTFTVPGLIHDTVIQLDTHTAGLSNIFKKYKLDSLSAIALQKEVKTYIINRPFFNDTVVINLPGGGFVKLYQNGNSLKHIINQPPRKITQTLPVAINSVYRDIPWRLPWYWGVIAFVCGIAIALYLMYKFKKPV